MSGEHIANIASRSGWTSLAELNRTGARWHWSSDGAGATRTANGRMIASVRLSPSSGQWVLLFDFDGLGPVHRAQRRVIELGAGVPGLAQRLQAVDLADAILDEAARAMPPAAA